MPQTDTVSAYPTLINKEGLKDLLNGISPYTTRRYRTTFTTSTISSTLIIGDYIYAIPHLILEFYTETLDSSTNNELQLFDLIEIIVTTSDSISFPMIILKASVNNNNVFVKLYINDTTNETYISGVCVDIHNSNRRFIIDDFMSLSDILYMLDNVNRMY